MAVGRALEPLLHHDPLMARERHALAAIEAEIGHPFARPALLEEALTHVSAGTEGRSYQRLEFLGDRVLGLVVTGMLFDAFPAAPEGELSKRLAALVRKEVCAEVARDWSLGDYLRLGAGERRSGAREREAILADACEALIGAVYLDGGLEAADRLVRANWLARMVAPAIALRDAKTTLQEVVQAKGLPVPVYRDVGRKGPDHAPEFEVAVKVERHAEARGTGRTKRLAERAAAENWLRREDMWEDGR